MIKQKLAAWAGEGNERMSSVLSGVLLAYLAVYFLVPYKPWALPVSLHTPLLILGAALAGLRLLARNFSFKALFSDDAALFPLTLLFFLVSTLLVHSASFSIGGFQAYLFSFLCYIFVRSAVRHLDLELFHAWVNIFLIVSAVLILLQINFAGLSYVSGLLGHYGFGRTAHGWGFANSATLAGGVMAWLTTLQLARYSFSEAGKPRRFQDSAELCAIGLGAVGLFYTLSRAAWGGYLVGAACVFITLRLAKLPKKRFARAAVSSAAFLAVFGVFLGPEVYHKKEKLMFFSRIFFAPGITVAQDLSVNTRALAWGVAVDGIKSAPVWGIGLDRFPAYYRRAYPALTRSAKGAIDLNQSINPHNSYLYYAVEVGLLPACFLFLLIGRVLITGLKYRPSIKAYPFLMGLIAVCVWTTTNDFLKERIFWIVLALAAGLVSSKRGEEPPPALPSRS